MFIDVCFVLFCFVNFTSFFFNFIFKLYIIVLVLPNIKMNLPQVYMCLMFFDVSDPYTDYLAIYTSP